MKPRAGHPPGRGRRRPAIFASRGSSGARPFPRTQADVIPAKDAKVALAQGWGIDSGPSTVRPHIAREGNRHLQAAIPRNDVTEHTETAREPRATILVVDDDDGVRRISRRMLERYGYQVLEAATGPEALDVAASHEGAIDLMVVDVLMPGMTGNQASHHLRDLRPGVPILCISGHPENEVVRYGIAGHGTAFLQKPFTYEQLAGAVQALIGAH